MAVGDLKEYSEFIRELVTAAQQAKKAGRTVDEFANTWKVPERFKGYTQPPAASLRSNAQVVWDETKKANILWVLSQSACRRRRSHRSGRRPSTDRQQLPESRSGAFAVDNELQAPVSGDDVVEAETSRSAARKPEL